jgi:hypothetical protein
MPRTPDPVNEPAEYQAHLLGLLGDDDPAVVQLGTPGAIRSMVQQAGDRVRERPGPAEWSVLECLGHLLDAEIVYSGRYRWILAHDEPELIGYDQDDWVTRLRHNQDDPEQSLALFEALRGANLALWERTPVEERPRAGMHRERGPESFELSFRMIAGHDRFHLAQAGRALDAVRSA